MKNLKLFLIVGFVSFAAFAVKPPPYQTAEEPVVGVGEELKVYKQHPFSCEEYKKLIFCPAYGILGQRLCYVKIQNYFIVAENSPEEGGSYVGNDCFSMGRIASFACKNNIESAQFNEVYCIDKKLK